MKACRDCKHTESEQAYASQFGVGVVGISQFAVAGYALAQFAVAHSCIAQIGLYIDEGYGRLVSQVSQVLAGF